MSESVLENLPCCRSMYCFLGLNKTLSHSKPPQRCTGMNGKWKISRKSQNATWSQNGMKAITGGVATLLVAQFCEITLTPLKVTSI